ncbi:MAG: ferritin-like domain-containing protein [Anaerolineae bacterium]|nr:ferritin-like domain-containing protein [Anaerolineae bacterium]
MELGTFGAILRFAMQLEEQSAAFYAAASGTVSLFDELEQAARKRLARLEQARREGVAEMILESITGLDSETYTTTLDPQASAASLRAQARALEEAAARFYRDAAARLPIREVARLFQRLAQEHETAAQQLGEETG